MSQVSIRQTLQWAKETAKESRDWNACSPREFTKEQLDAFEAGCQQGFGNAIRTLRLHGYKFS